VPGKTAMNKTYKNPFPEIVHPSLYVGGGDDKQNKYIKYNICDLIINVMEKNKAGEWDKVLLEEGRSLQFYTRRSENTSRKENFS
jgi:hypothetical protein